MKNKTLTNLLYVIVSVVVITIDSYVCAEYEVDDVIKRNIKYAGCPFMDKNQLLERNVCLMPDYSLNEMPKNFKNGSTRVNIYLLHVYVLEVDETRNQITIEILQYMDWNEPRVSANFSSAHNKNKIKLS